MPLLTKQFKSLFHPSQSFLPHYDLNWPVIAFLAVSVMGTELESSQNVETIWWFSDPQPEKKKKSVNKRNGDEGELENSYLWENVG